LRFNISSHEEVEKLADISNTLFLDVWESADDWVDIRLGRSLVPSLLKLLPESLQTSHVPLMQGRQFAQAVLDTYPSRTPITHQVHEDGDAERNIEESLFFEDYRPYSAMIPWMRYLQSMYQSHVEVISIGTSAEGRDITALRVGAKPTAPDPPTGPRQTILIIGGQHAREWISTSTVNYVAWSLITAYEKTRAITRLLERYDFVLIPTINPDGYAYTWEVDRLWRKNRQQTSSRSCQGVDLDRSWGFMWNGNATLGNPCSESYAGEASLEGLEARVLSDWASAEVKENNVEFVGFFDLHSYSQQILYPYSFSCSQRPPTMEDLEELGEGLAKAARTNRGSRYAVTSACRGSVLRSSSKEPVRVSKTEIGGGSALDWFYHQLHVRHAFQIKLRDKGSHGFLLPKHHIIPTGTEIFQAIQYFGRSLLLSMNTRPLRAINSNDQTVLDDVVDEQ